MNSSWSNTHADGVSEQALGAAPLQGHKTAPELPVFVRSNLVARPTDCNSTKRHDTRRISAVVGFYMLTSLAVVFLNKTLMSSAVSLPLPLTVTWLQLVIALGILVICGAIGQSHPRSPVALIPPFEFDRKLARGVLPLSVVYVLMLALNNACLMHVEVTFYQVARSLTILFTTAFTWWLLGKTTSQRAIIACGTVLVGFVLGSAGELRFTWTGTLLGVASSVFVALYGIFVKRVLPLVNNNQWRLLHYNTSLSVALMVPILALSGEAAALPAYTAILFDRVWCATLLLTGMTGFLINVAIFAQIKYTTPLTNTISGTAKACLQTALASAIYRNPISSMNALGLFLSLAGSAYYSVVRFQEMAHK